MAQTIDKLKWTSLTPLVNDIKSPNQAVRRMLFGDHETKATEDIEIDSVSKGREIAPFVRVNGEGILVTGASSKFQTIKAPNIRIKRAFTPTELLFGRQPGSLIFLGGQGDLMAEVDTYVARETGILADLVVNSEELLSCQLLTGTISYSSEDGDVFQLTLPRDAGQTIDLGAGNYWDHASQPDPNVTVRVLKRLIADQAGGLVPTDVIMGKTASEAFQTNTNIKATLTQQNPTSGVALLGSQFQEDGLLPIGRLYNMNWWEYPRTVSVNGVATDLIRAKYAEFVCRLPSAEFKLYYGAISDLRAMEGAALDAMSEDEEDGDG